MIGEKEEQRLRGVRGFFLVMIASAPPVTAGVLLIAGCEDGYPAPRAITAVTVEAVILSHGLRVRAVTIRILLGEAALADPEAYAILLNPEWLFLGEKTNPRHEQRE